MKKGFTIIELLVVIFIFSIVMILTSSAFTTSFLAGRTRSTGSQEANRSLSLILDVIGQKMTNASGKTTVSSTVVSGFHVDNTGLLTIVLKDASQCAYFGKVGDAIKMSQQACASSAPTLATLSETISSSTLKITTFDLTARNEYSVTKTAPYLIVKISAQDTTARANKNSLETAYNIPAYTYNKW